MDNQIEKILKFVELSLERKTSIMNFDHLKYQVSALLMNEVFGASINEGMKVSLLGSVSNILFDSGEKAIFSKTEHEWGTFCSISVGESKILYDPVKDFLQITDAATEKGIGNVVLYKCSKDVMTRTVSNSKETETIVYASTGLQKNKIRRGTTDPMPFMYEEHIARDENELHLIHVDETVDNDESFSISINKVARIWELDNNVGTLYQGDESNLDEIYSQLISNIEKEPEYKYFPAFKKKVLELIEMQFVEVPNRVRER